jgi:hypothetical protein
MKLAVNIGRRMKVIGGLASFANPTLSAVAQARSVYRLIVIQGGLVRHSRASRSRE